MPDWAQHVRPRLSSLHVSPTRENEIVEELSQHLEDRWRELMAAGTSPDEATRLALAEFSEENLLARHMTPLRQAHAPVPITPGTPAGHALGDLWQDLRYAARMLRKQPGFAAAAILTLAFGIGANSAIFALVDATLLRPLPFPDADRLVMVWEQTETSARARVAPLNLADWNERNRTFEVIGGFVPNIGGMVLSAGEGTPDTISRQWVTVGIFDALGVKAIVGRTFLRSDDRRHVVVLSEALWRARFNADPQVVGSDLRLDGDLWTVVGIVPQEAQVIGQASMWALRSDLLGISRGSRTAYMLQAIGRLKPGVTLDAAAADMSAVAGSIAQEFPNTNKGRSVVLEPLRDVVIGGDLRRTSLLFLGVVGFVLLICCANVANLLLARATARRRELAIRSALGAYRGRLIRLLLTESLTLAVLGGTLGLAAGAAMLGSARAVIPPEVLPPVVALTFDLRVVAFCAAASLFVGVVFGLAPAWQAAGFASPEALGSESRTTTARGRLGELLVIGQVGAAVMLLFGAGLLLRTLLVVENVDRGYGAESALTMIVDPPFGGERLMPFYEAVEQEVGVLPGVRGVAWATTLPMGRSYQGPSFVEIVGDPPPLESQRPTADYQIVSPAYFQTLDLPVVAGRGFDDRDTAANVAVCMVNEAFVRRHLQGRSPIGARIAIRPTLAALAPPVVREVVGVVRQVKGRPDEREEFVQIYVPLAQHTPGDIFMVVRPASGRADALAPAVRAALGRVDKAQQVSVRSVMTLEDVAWEATARHRFRAVLVLTFAGLALLLAMVGVFGVFAYAVQRRTRDFGVRRALGATNGDVLRLVVGSAVRVIATGAVIGLVVSGLLGRLLATVLFGVQPWDPVTFASVTIVLALTATAAIAGPAWRATRIDPLVALRAE